MPAHPGVSTWLIYSGESLPSCLQLPLDKDWFMFLCVQTKEPGHCCLTLDFISWAQAMGICIFSSKVLFLCLVTAKMRSFCLQLNREEPAGSQYLSFWFLYKLPNIARPLLFRLPNPSSDPNILSFLCVGGGCFVTALLSWNKMLSLKAFYVLQKINICLKRFCPCLHLVNFLRYSKN